MAMDGEMTEAVVLKPGPKAILGQFEFIDVGNNLFYSNIWDGKERVKGNFIID